MGTTIRPERSRGDQAPYSPAQLLAIVAAVVLSFGAVHAFPESSPLRILAGLSLVLALPGVALRMVLIGDLPHAERWATWVVDVAISMAASSLIALGLALMGIGLSTSTISIALSTCVLALVGILALERRGQDLDMRSTRSPGAYVFMLGVGAIGLGVIAGSVLGRSEDQESFTVFALASPTSAAAAIDKARETGSSVLVEVLVESQEDSTTTFDFQVSGAELTGSLPGAFTLVPGQQRSLFLELAPHHADAMAVRIDLVRSGSIDPYRTVTIPIPSAAP